MQKTLMLNIEGYPTPFSIQVPEEVYNKFVHYEKNQHCHKNLITQIEAACRVHQKRCINLFNQIAEWEFQTEKEIQMYNRLETAKKNAATLFS